jgi:hypothetical protein
MPEWFVHACGQSFYCVQLLAMGNIHIGDHEYAHQLRYIPALISEP